MLQNRFTDNIKKGLTTENEYARNGLSWQEWVIKKAYKNKERLKEKKFNVEAEKQKQDSTAIEKERQSLKAKNSYRKWLKSLKQKEEQAASFHARKAIKTKEENLIRKEELGKKAAAIYEEWINKKRMQERQKQKKFNEERTEVLKNFERRRRESQEAYRMWLARAKPSSPSNYIAYGYINGTLTSYYDSSAKPKPSYFNPIPWDCGIVDFTLDSQSRR
ncbi:Coiled-coil domain-containing protein 34 [Trichoplax sp. H2]|uniref:Coiled-coil domain-containing protein n=1 Tax=Trichoplax adhaerens TaxID=10228 RepID=B3SC22_TRIAD|nr:hypothetical protein TRIADDRAFT_61822 [Trichoplax adhaerens]EDV19776.1 hypothetical protein TRIADDRAFT_61822 [Trichoplax adhaerens]RDD41163.1 Coiled-coil domain-containing protein 34 [Trichoplax sp. H2]|eukprot:XP_002117800.1 hypothetical protein TRIADDRAFT_61822 [Trichoplax adhaerens]